MSFYCLQAVRELGETAGSNIRTIEKFISNSYELEGDTESDLHELLRVAAKKSLSRGLVIHNSESGAFKAVAGRKGTGKNKHDRNDKDRERKKERRRERKEKKLRKLQLQKNVSSSTEESPKVGSLNIFNILLQSSNCDGKLKFDNYIPN